MTKNLKKAVKHLSVGATCNEETHPVNYEKAIKHLQRKGIAINENTDNENADADSDSAPTDVPV